MERAGSGFDRYRAEGEGARRLEVTTFEGVDTLTEHPVLIYRFAGDPTILPGDYDSRFLPKLVWSGVTSEGGAVVVALPAGARRWSEDEGPPGAGQLLGLARGLRDAAAVGLVHGDIDSGRFLLGGDQVLLEGFGVPWHGQQPKRRQGRAQDDPAAADDVRDFARAVIETGFSSEDATVAGVLDQCLLDEPDARPSAEELFLALEALLTAQAEKESVPPPTRATAGAARGIPSAARVTPAEGGAHAGARPASPATPPAPAMEARRAVQPDGDYHQQEDSTSRTRIVLVGALLAAIVVLALLALYLPGRQSQPPPAGQATLFVVEVDVFPEDLPPVEIHLVSSPPGSDFENSENLGTAPRYLSLDRAGTWAFQGTLQDRSSEVVEIQVPEQREITLTIPPAQQ